MVAIILFNKDVKRVQMNTDSVQLPTEEVFLHESASLKQVHLCYPCTIVCVSSIVGGGGG